MGIFNIDIVCSTLSELLSKQYGCDIEFTMTRKNAEHGESDVSNNAESSTYQTNNAT